MPVDLDDVRNTHRRVKTSKWSNLKDRCLKCDRIWPCDAIQLADEIEQLREKIAVGDSHEERRVGMVIDAHVEVERLRALLGEIRVELANPCGQESLDKIFKLAHGISDPEKWRTENQDTARRQQSVADLIAKGTLL